VVAVTRPLAIDLYCGLRQAEFFPRADSAIKEFVACGADDPDHMSLRIGDDSPCPISLEFGPVSNFKDAGFAACLARIRQVRISTSKSTDDRILKRSFGIIDLSKSRLAAHKFTTLLARRLSGTIFGTISAISAGRHDFKVLPATKTIAASLGDIALFSSSPAARLSLAFGRAISLIWTLCLEGVGTNGAKQIIHSDGLS
jgi:hypothetical protein